MEAIREKDIRTVLHVTNATAKMIAKQMDVQQSTVTHALRGERQNPETIEKLADTIGNHVALQIKTALMPQAN